MRIAFYKGKRTLFNRFVRWWDNGEYSHCEAIIDHRTELDIPLYCWSSSFEDKGVRPAQITFHPDRWDVIDVPGFNADNALEWFADHEDDEYDIAGLMSTSTPVKHNKRSWFCSEAIAESIGFKESWRFKPNILAVVCESHGGIWVQKT